MNEFGKTISVFLIILVFSCFFPLASAKTSEGYFHSSDFYVVTFDGEGDAIVSAKLNIDNFTEETIDSFDLEIPGRARIYKAVFEYNGRSDLIDYDTDLTSNSTILHLYLPEEIEPNRGASIVLMYKISENAEKDIFGTFNFDFKTIVDKDAALIQRIRVAVNFQEGLHLKGGEGKIEYKPEFFGEVALGKMASAELTSPYYRDYSNAIEYEKGSIVKEAYNLDPFESFHVKGQYSENWFILFFTDILLWIIILGLLGIIVKKFVWKQITEVKEVIETEPFKPKRKQKSIETKETQLQENNLGLILSTGFLSSLAVIAYWWFIVLIIPFLSSVVGWNLSAVIGLLFFLLGIAVTGILIIVPGIYFGKKKGFSTGLWIVVSTILWLFVLGIISLVIIALLTQPSYTYTNYAIKAID
ncbi:MAG: hypothetical protein ABIE23_05360 [archaeon]|nr:hypothetical protein [Candidatus Micrarchaeota archaeon]